MFACYLEGAVLLEVKDEIEAELRDDLAELRAEEAAVLSLLEARLKRDLSVTKENLAETRPASRSVKRSGSLRREDAAAARA